MKRISLVGQQFSRLEVIATAGRDAKGNTQSLARCVCGVEKLIANRNLIRGNTRSCGCLQREVASENGKKFAAGRWKNHVKVVRPKSLNTVGRPVKVFSTEAWNRLKELRANGSSLRVMANTIINEGLIDHIGYVSIKNYLPKIDQELAQDGYTKNIAVAYKVTWSKTF